MRRSGFVLPALSMGLLYSSIYVGLIIINLRGSASSGRGDFGVLLHFALIALSASGLYVAVRKGTLLLRPLAALLALAGCVCVVLPFLSVEMAERIFNGRPPVLAMGMAFFMPMGLFLFFRTVPTGKAGFYFALVISGSELLWALLFPLLGGVSGGVSSQLPGQQAFHLFFLCSWMLGCAGLCLAVSLVREFHRGAVPPGDPPSPRQAKPACVLVARESVVVTPDAAIPDAQAETAKPGKRAALCLIFTAGVGVFCMMGLHMGMLMPKTAVLPKLIGIAHFAFLFLLPLVGRMLDENPGRLMLMGVHGLAAAFLLGLLHEYGLIGRMPLFYMLNFMQSFMLLTAYTATSRLLKTHAAFPLVITLAHCLYMTHAGGAALRGLAGTVPHGVAGASLLLASGVAFCLWRFRRLLAKESELWALPRQEKTPEPETEPELSHAARLAAVAVHYGLGERETQVLDLLMQGVDDQEAAERLDVKKVSIRTTIHRIKEKTGTASREELAQLSIR